MSESLGGAFLQGIGLSAGHVVALGAQNAFILREGLLGRRPAAAAVASAGADAFLVTIGVAGIGPALARTPMVERVALWAGAAYLLVHAGRAFLAAVRPRQRVPNLDGDPGSATRSTAAQAIALSLLNPHAFLDAVVLFGGVSAHYPVVGRVGLAAGAVIATTTWYAVLAAGATRLAPAFRHPRAWRVVEIVVSIIMLTVAISLVVLAMDPRGRH